MQQAQHLAVLNENEFAPLIQKGTTICKVLYF